MVVLLIAGHLISQAPSNEMCVVFQKTFYNQKYPPKFLKFPLSVVLLFMKIIVYILCYRLDMLYYRSDQMNGITAIVSS